MNRYSYMRNAVPGRTWLLALVVVVALGAGASTALADSPHFKKGGTPTCRDTGTQLVCTGTLAGLGNGDLVLDLSSDAQASYACGNPGKNSKQAPGVNKVPFTASGSTTIQGSDIKNGTTTFSVTAPGSPPTPPDPATICPNGNWTTVTLTNIDFSNVVLQISQGGLLFTCTYPGVVPSSGSVTLSC